MTNHPPATDAARQSNATLRWAMFAVPIAALAIFVGINVASEAADSSDLAEHDAPGFELPTLTGETVALDDVLSGGDALLFFSMGVGCDGCFAQIPEVEDELTARGIDLIPIKVNAPEDLAREAARFGIDRPILVDADRRVSDAYGMLGQFGHGDLPSHSFAHVSSDGTIEHTLHYAEMFVPLDQLLTDLELS